MQPHQQRVVDEKAELDKKLTALDLFIETNAIFKKLDPAEQSRLKRQSNAMAEYSMILEERIAAFQFI